MSCDLDFDSLVSRFSELYLLSSLISFDLISTLLLFVLLTVLLLGEPLLLAGSFRLYRNLIMFIVFESLSAATSSGRLNITQLLTVSSAFDGTRLRHYQKTMC